MSPGGDDGFPEEHEEHVNREAWIIPYADLMTLLMAMFIALFAMSTVDVTKFKAFAIGFHEALGGGKIDAGVGGSGRASSPAIGAGLGDGPFTGGNLMPRDAVAGTTQLQQVLSSVAATKAQAAVQRQTLENVQKQIDDAANRLGFKGEVRTKQLNNGLQVTLLTDQVLFKSGMASLQQEGLHLLNVIGEILKSIDNTIDINGFTDNVPIGPGGQFPSNLYLSSFRADAVADYFALIGLSRSRMFPAGRGDQDFIASNATAAGRAQNRRVEIIVQSKVVEQTLDQAGFDNQPVTPSTLPIDSGDVTDPGATPNLGPNLAGN